MPSTYVYGVYPACEAAPTDLSGLGDAPVRVLAEGDLAALVSDAPAARLRPERRHLAAHQKVLQRASAELSLLPMAFGTVLAGDGRVKGFLRAHAGLLGEQIDRVRGRAEMTLRVRLDVANVFEHLVAVSPELRALRDLIAAGRASHDDKVQAGREVDATLSSLRASSEAAVLEALVAAAAEIRLLPPRTEAELLNLACLVDRGALQAFESAVHAAAARFDDRHAFELSGPWPPHSFVGQAAEAAATRAAA